MLSLHCYMTFMIGCEAFLISINCGGVVIRDQLMMLVSLKEPNKHLGKTSVHTLCRTYQCANEAGSSSR